MTVGCIVPGLDDDRAPRRLCLRHHLRHQQRVRLRLSARQHEVPRSTRWCSATFNYAIVDEVDSILIDEARTPLIISGPIGRIPRRSTSRVDAFIPNLIAEDFEKDEKAQPGHADRAGRRACRAAAARRRPAEGRAASTISRTSRLVHHINQALRAHKMFRRDTDYIVKDGKVIIIDEFTGRMMDGPPLFGRAAPGARGQGRRDDPARVPDLRLHHLPELFPHVSEARGHDRHGDDRSRRSSPTSTASR